MNKYVFNAQWPEDEIFCNIYVHKNCTYRYNFHITDYEINIILHGKAEFRYGDKSSILLEDDVLLINPGVGHASFALEEDTIALVMKFSVNAFRRWLKNDEAYYFSDCISDTQSRNSISYRRIRYFCAQLLYALSHEDTFSDLMSKASVEMLLAFLCYNFKPQVIYFPVDRYGVMKENVRQITKFIEENYAQKITLDDLAAFTHYNRTYLSSFFKNSVGMNFYEYLTRIRFQMAVKDLTVTTKSLTDIAIDNGFSDLRSFNKRFKETFGLSPADYRKSIPKDQTSEDYSSRDRLPPDLPIVQKKLREYIFECID